MHLLQQTIANCSGVQYNAPCSPRHANNSCGVSFVDDTCRVAGQQLTGCSGVAVQTEVCLEEKVCEDEDCDEGNASKRHKKN